MHIQLAQVAPSYSSNDQYDSALEIAQHCSYNVGTAIATLARLHEYSNKFAAQQLDLVMECLSKEQFRLTYDPDKPEQDNSDELPDD